jgi:UPF0716 protein FxsA
MPLLLLVLCLGLPVLEIWAAIEVAGQIGALPTIVSLVALSLIGGWLLRYESTRAWRSFTAAVSTGDRPHRAASNGALSVLGSVLLVIPGFVTAAFGLLCLFPPTRLLLRGLAVAVLMRPAMRRANLVGGLSGNVPGGLSGNSFGNPADEPIRVHATRGHPVIDGDVEE